MTGPGPGCAMPVHAACPTCGASYELTESTWGKYVRCRGCGDSFLVGGAADVTLAEDPGERRRERPVGGTPAPRRRRRAPEGEDEGTSPLVWVAVGIGGALLLFVGVCAGVIWYVSTSVGRAVDRVVERAKNPPPRPPFARDPQPGRPVTDLNDALARLRSASPAERAEGARWLGRQPVDRARRDEVLEALRPLLTDPDFDVRVAANQAFVTWHQALP